MTPDDFKTASAALGMTAGSYARVSGRNVNTVQNWIRPPPNGTRIPDRVAEWLKRRLADLARDPAP